MDLVYTPKILLVDDIEENLITLKGNLKSLNAEMYCVQSGQDALLKVRQYDFALIMLDVQMPDMDGFETAERIRQGRRNQHTPIIFITAVYFDNNSIYKGYRTGAVDYITKPFNKEVLLGKASIFLDLDRIKNELIQSKKEFQNIVQDQTDLICRIDSNFYINFANRALLIAFTKTFESIKGQNILNWVDNNDLGKFNKSLGILNPTNSIIKIHHRLNVSQGKQIWVSTIIRALYDANYKHVGYQLVMRDITKEKKTSEEVIIAKQKAEEVTQSKSNFLANMSHEIRTPMNSILGMIEVLLETNLDEDQKEDVEVIQHSGRKLLEIINEILDLSKIEANQIKIQKIWFNLHDEINSIIRLYKIDAQKKGNTLTYKIDPNVPKKINGDSLRIVQIISNLINNALKFTKKGSIKFTVETFEETETKSKFRFTVSDTGIGISEGAREHIFNYFEQSDPTISQNYGGTGLGLAISKRLCEMMGGTIGFESEIKKGTNFWFVLELEHEPKIIEKNDDKLKFLIVEDNLLNQKVMSATLKRNNINFDLAGNGLEAFEMFKDNNYRLIIMDLQMPVMDGFEATRQIRNYEKDLPDDKKTKIIALTANATNEDQNKCLKAGMNDFMTKPFNFSEFNQIIHKMFDRREIN